MTELAVDDFSDYFQALHGVPPFPWQTELAKQVLVNGKWPSLLDLPTSAGKTATIDVGVFHLAMEAGLTTPRRAPLRIFFVIDRRIVVDEAYNRALKIATALRCPKHPVLKSIAERLKLLSGDPEMPLDVVRLRGGMPQERDWARTPAQPLVVVSTVDQVGSRLLFRGYGVSDRMRPVHAGLVGSDALWLLDEVHLSQPFEQTLDAIVAGHAGNIRPGLLSTAPRLAPFSVVKLTATPGSEQTADVFPGTFDIRRDAPSVFLKRLGAQKITNLVETGADPVQDFVKHAVRFLRGEPKAGTKIIRNKGKTQNAPGVQPVFRLAVVVNRVSFAREIFERLTKEISNEADVTLLTGRVRPLDRERIISRLTPLFARTERPAPDKPIIVVATQSIEAGADFDVDALVSEIAPLDCLRQRFGRLDRLGERGRTQAVILCPPGKPAPKSDKPAQRTCPWVKLRAIYGDAPYVTRQWLGKIRGAIDFGIDGMAQHLAGLAPDKLIKMLAPRAQAPYLLPSYAGLWSTTSPVPLATPEPSLFLHGPGAAPEVRVVWRADVQPRQIPTSLELSPPASAEAMSLPLWAVRRWLHQQPDTMVADVPQADPGWSSDINEEGRLILRAYEDGWRWISAGAIHADDMIVVPVGYGGCDEWGWNPVWQGEVLDYGVEAHYHQRLKGAVRISPATLGNAWKYEPGLANVATAMETWQSITAWLKGAGDDLSAEAIFRQVLAENTLPHVWRTVLAACMNKRIAVSWHDEVERSAGFTLYALTRLPDGLLKMQIDNETCGSPALTGQRASSATGVTVTLRDHSTHVANLVRNFCSRIGLVDSLAVLLILAARFHDVGKAEPRFQVDLHGFGVLAWNDPAFAELLRPSGDLLAKSMSLDDGRRVRDAIRKATPRNFRHEALSVALAKQHPEIMALKNHDRDLVLWLIGTHHGYGRPFFPPCVGLASANETTLRFDDSDLAAHAKDSPVQMDQGWFELADRMHRLFGPWELARLEAIIRLADHVASAIEQNNATSGTEKHHV